MEVKLQFLKQSQFICKISVNCEEKKLTESCTKAKILNVSRKSHHLIETLSITFITFLDLENVRQLTPKGIFQSFKYIFG